MTEYRFVSNRINCTVTPDPMHVVSEGGYLLVLTIQVYISHHTTCVRNIHTQITQCSNVRGHNYFNVSSNSYQKQKLDYCIWPLSCIYINNYIITAL